MKGLGDDPRRRERAKNEEQGKRALYVCDEDFFEAVFLSMNRVWPEPWPAESGVD